MSAVPLVGAPVAQSPRTSRLPAVVVLCLVAVLGVALLVASLVPSAALAGRLLNLAGETGVGTYTQKLESSLDDRLRFAGFVLLAMVGGLAVGRAQLEEMVASAVHDVRRARWHFQPWAGVGIGLTALALGVRAPFLGQPMRYDEALTFNEFASRPLYYGLSFYPDPNNHLLNTLLMHVASMAFGGDPWVLRLPALVGGGLLVPAALWLGWLLFDRWAGLLAGVLVGASSYLVEYSTNARGYTLQALCFVLLLGLVVIAARRGSLSALLLAAGVAALGAWAVPTMLYGVAVAAAWLLFELRTPALAEARRVRPGHLVVTGLLLGLLAFLLYLPVVLVSGPDNLTANRFVLPLGAAELGSELVRSLGQTWAFWNRDIPWPLAAVLLAGFAIGSWRVPLGVVAVGVCLLLVVLQRVDPFERVWLFLLPLYLTIAAGGLARFVDGRILAAVFGLVLGFLTLTSGSILSSTETGVFPDAEAVARTLAPRLAPDDAVTTTLPTALPELQYYFPRFRLPTNVLVRAPDQAQNLWIIAPGGVEPSMAGWPTVIDVQRFAGSELYELKRGSARR